MGVRSIAGSRVRLHWFSLVIAEYSICNLGHFAVMAILSLYVVRTLDLSPAQAGGVMLAASLSFRLSRILTAPLVVRLPTRLALCLALCLTGAGYLGLALEPVPLAALGLLLVVGIGHGTNSLLVKTLAASARDTALPGAPTRGLFLRYASLTTGVNVGAAVGSMLGSALLARGATAGVFLMAAATYLISGLIALRIPSAGMGEPQRRDWVAGYRLSLASPSVRRSMLMAFLGWLLYTQLYSSLPLFVGEALGRTDLLGSFFGVNALLVVFGQLPLSRALAAFPLSMPQVVKGAFALFAVGFCALMLIPVWQTVYVAVALWTLGEMLLMPALDTLFAEGALDGHKQVAFTLNAASVSLGEGFGNFAGVLIAATLLRSGDPRQLYGTLALVAVGVLLVTHLADHVAGDRAARLDNWHAAAPPPHRTARS